MSIMNSITTMPEELQNKILEYIPQTILGRLASVCKIWEKNSNEAYITKSKYRAYKEKQVQLLKQKKINEKKIWQEKVENVNNFIFITIGSIALGIFFGLYLVFIFSFLKVPGSI